MINMLKIILAIVLLGVVGYGQGFTRNVGCKFEVDLESMTLPILYKSDGSRVYPTLNSVRENGKGYFEIPSGETFWGSCSSSTTDNNRFLNSKESNDVKLECVTGSTVKTSAGLQSFESLECERDLTPTIYRNGTCYNGYTNIQIAFQTANPVFHLLSACHDENKDETYYVQHQIDGPNLHLTESSNNPSFSEGGFFNEIDANGCYTPVGQIATVATLLGSASLADDYIKQSVNLFMSRGHLAPNGDPIYAYEKRATYYYFNAHPQWQTINGGNWNNLENAVRAYAKTKQRVLDVFTGTYGVTTLDDVNGNPVEIWLGKSSNGNLVERLPCPHLTWKVIHDKVGGTGVAIIQINNPYATVKPEDILCENVCSQLPWVTWNVNDMRLGYTYCCTVESFKRGLDYAPNLGSLPLLKY